MHAAVTESCTLAERLGELLLARRDAPYTVARVCTTTVPNPGGSVPVHRRNSALNTLKELYARLASHRAVQTDLVADTIVCRRPSDILFSH